MKPQLVQGTRDFSPEEVNRRNYIFDTIKKVFIKFGYQPLETPAMEGLETLTGKYGEEGDQLLFKILNNGDFLKTIDLEQINNYNLTDSNESDPRLASRKKEKIAQNFAFNICKRGLRFDLTVPFARYVVMNRNEIVLPFKRYQIQPVWRGDSPQKGRYREFYQCDIDVIGSSSLMYEAELLQIYDEVFSKLKIDVIIRFNNRKILEGMAAEAGFPEKFTEITVAIDKLDKIGWDGVKKELFEKGISENGFERIKQITEIQDINELKNLFSTNNAIGQKGVEELEKVLTYLSEFSFKNTFKLDFSLARGLSYYTGGIFEVVVNTKTKDQESVKMGSIGGGGRYDNLTGIFGWEGISGVGISFGADRIYDVMLELNLFNQVSENSTELFFMAFDAASHLYAFNLVQKTRVAGINSDIYPEPAKFQKQMKYADKRKFSTVVIIGEEEMNTGLLTVKNMTDGSQKKLTIEEVISFFS
jgi:histidyl-tRNA synthetase